MISASRQRFPSARFVAAAAAVAVACASPGCKSGSSWAAKPSWWTFGNDDPAKLADAPPAATDVAMPSATSKPYPTTTTPEGYVMEMPSVPRRRSRWRRRPPPPRHRRLR